MRALTVYIYIDAFPHLVRRSKNPSSFWLSVAKKDYGDVYSRPASDQYFKVLRSEPEIKSWTYRYSPRSKAAYWDWHYERPADRVRQKTRL